MNLAVEQKETERQLEWLRKGVSAELVKCGFSVHSSGYMYLREAVTAVFRDEELLFGITKNLYPYIADKYATSACAVEKAIRQAINDVCKSGIPDCLRSVFSEEKKHLTNKEFIAVLVNEVKKVKINSL